MNNTIPYIIGHQGSLVGASVNWKLTDASTWTDTTNSYDYSSDTGGVDAAGAFASGRNLYIIVSNKIYQYLLPEDGNVSGATLVATNTTLRTTENFVNIWFSPDGLSMFISYFISFSDAQIRKYSLSVAWDITSTITLQQQTTIFSYFGDNPKGMFISPDGLKMFVVTNNGGTKNYREYSLSTAWDITSTTQVDTKGSVNDRVLVFNPNGTQFYDTGSSDKMVYIHDLPSEYGGVSTESSYYYEITSLPQYLTDILLSDDGNYAYFIIGASERTIRQWQTDVSPI